MAKKVSYAYAVAKTRPDFIGRLVGMTADFLTLENPFVVEYTTIGEPVLNTDYMPMGYAPRYEDKFTVTLPMAGLIYVVTLNEDDELAKMYLTHKDLSPERAQEIVREHAEEWAHKE